MYVLRMLNDYRVADEQTIIDASTGEMMQLQSDGQYLLTTDEVVDLKLTQKTIRLKRRFTPATIAKLLESGTLATETSGTVENGTVNVGQSDKVGQIIPISEQSGTVVYFINGTPYASLRDAAEATGVSKSTLQRRFDKGEEGYLKN